MLKFTSQENKKELMEGEKMQSLLNDKNFELIIADILSDKDFNKIKEIKHHGLNRLDHSLRVAYYSYKIARFLKLDYKAVARGGLLHDFFYEENDKSSISKKFKTLIEHPQYALKKANSKFELNDKEKNIIVSHMFPVSVSLPKYLESWIVDLVDDGVAIYEVYKAYSVYLRPVTNLLALFILNIFR